VLLYVCVCVCVCINIVLLLVTVVQDVVCSCDVIVDGSTSEPTATIFKMDLLLAFGSDCSTTT
jgi:hypothetical protein